MGQSKEDKGSRLIVAGIKIELKTASAIELKSIRLSHNAFCR